MYLFIIKHTYKHTCTTMCIKSKKVQNVKRICIGYRDYIEVISAKIICFKCAIIIFYFFILLCVFTLSLSLSHASTTPYSSPAGQLAKQFW